MVGQRVFTNSFDPNIIRRINVCYGVSIDEQRTTVWQDRAARPYGCAFLVRRFGFLYHKIKSGGCLYGNTTVERIA